MLTVAPWNRLGACVSNHTQASSDHTVEKILLRRMDEVLKSLKSLTISKVDFIKIDVEGFEGHVLRGVTQTLATYRAIIAIEVSHWCLNAFQRTSIPEFFDLLCSMCPIFLAVDGSSYLNLHDESENDIVMYYHTLPMRVPYIFAAFDEKRLDRFMSLYKHQFIPQ
jgi:hypothetical protein